MGYRSRSATPGTILCLAASILLTLVSFNTPSLKSLYFLKATFSSGTYNGELKLGTLGYCLTYQGNTTCVGPQVGYEFNPNTLFNVSIFNIPEAVTKYLTYTLIFHIVALAFAIGATVFGLLSHISTLSLLCFPTCTASLASSFALLAFMFDIAIFYIAKARIDSVSGASATIGISVWLTLAAWLLAGFSGCAYSIGRCCVGARRNQDSGDPRGGQNPYSYSTKNGYRQPIEGPDEMRLHAIRDEQLRKAEQGLPSFQELERLPLTDNAEDKYLYDEVPPLNNGTGNSSVLGLGAGGGTGLRRDGSVLQGVGVGYGRKVSKSSGGAEGGGGSDLIGALPGAWPGQQHDNYGRSAGVYDTDSGLSAGAAGVGAGPAGVDQVAGYDPYGQGRGQRQGQGYGNDQYASEHQYGEHNQYRRDQGQNYYQNNYNDPYSNSQPASYDTYSNQHQVSTYPPGVISSGQQNIPTLNSVPTPAPQVHLGPHDYYTGGSTPTPGPMMRSGGNGMGSSESGFGLGPNVHHASNDLNHGTYLVGNSGGVGAGGGGDGGGGDRVSDAYDAYDDGLGAIGRIATSPSPVASGYGPGAYSNSVPSSSHSPYNNNPGNGYPSFSTNQYQRQQQQGLHIPTPQHLVGQGQSALLRSPIEDNGRSHNQELEMDDVASGRPPSYGAVAGNSGFIPPREKP